MVHLAAWLTRVTFGKTGNQPIRTEPARAGVRTAMAIDANLVGIGGIQKPRKVLLLVTFDIHDQNKQLERIVCTWPAKDVRVCRDWSDGKLIN